MIFPLQSEVILFAMLMAEHYELWLQVTVGASAIRRTTAARRGLEARSEAELGVRLRTCPAAAKRRSAGNSLSHAPQPAA